VTMHPDDEEELVKKVKRLEEENADLRNEQAELLEQVAELSYYRAQDGLE
jgi:uncharacterized protein (UPF0335 family)